MADYSIDLAVIGAVGRSGIAGTLVGSTAEHLVENLSCSVLVIKPDRGTP